MLIKFSRKNVLSTSFISKNSYVTYVLGLDKIDISLDDYFLRQYLMLLLQTIMYPLMWGACVRRFKYKHYMN